MDHPCNMNLNNKSILRSTSGCYLSGVIFLSPPSSPCFPQHWSNFPRCPLVLKSTGRNGISIPGELLHWSCSPLSSHYMGPWTLQGHKNQTSALLGWDLLRTRVTADLHLPPCISTLTQLLAWSFHTFATSSIILRTSYLKYFVLHF